MTRVLTVAPLGGADMSNWCGGWAKRNNRYPVSVPSLANLNKSSISEAADHLIEMVNDCVKNNEEVNLLAHSQGCQVVGEALARWLDGRTSAPSPGVLTRIVLTGNLERPRLGYIARKPWFIGGGNSVRTTPESTPWIIQDFGRKGDLWANYPGGIPNLLKMSFCASHLNYASVNPDSPTVLSKDSRGNSTYYVVP